MKIVRKKKAIQFNSFMMKSDISGMLFVGVTKPNIDRHFILTNEPKSLIDLVNGEQHPLDKFGDSVLFESVNGTLTID